MKRELLGVIFAVIAAFSVSLMGVFVKSLGPSFPTSVSLFARFLVSMALLWPMIYIDKKFTFKVTEPRRLIFRSLLGLTAMGLYFAALKSIPLTTAILLSNVTPAIVPLFVYFMLGIRTRKRVWAFIALSLAGIVIVLNPKGHVWHMGSLYAVLSSVIAALTVLQMRLLTKTHRETTLLFYYFGICTLLTAIWAGLDWQTPTWHQCVLLFWIGFFGGIYQLFLTWGIARAPARIVTPALLSSIVFGALWDHFIWDTYIAMSTFIGALVLFLGVLGVVRYQQTTPQKTETANPTQATKQ